MMVRSQVREWNLDDLDSILVKPFHVFQVRFREAKTEAVCQCWHNSGGLWVVFGPAQCVCFELFVGGPIEVDGQSELSSILIKRT